MQRNLKFALCIFLAIFALMCTSSALNVYVSNAGDDTAAGTADAPVATLTQAYALLGANGGKILLADAVPVTATDGDCFIAPGHTGKITVTSAPGASGALDLTDLAHFHFGGETEWNNIDIIANELVLTADNHTVIMGKGLTVSSPSASMEYRGGHRFCGAKLHLTAYCPCETADANITAAGGKLYVYSGEYRSISAFYGEAVTVSGGSTQIYLGTKTAADSIWVRYLCPGLFGASADEGLTASNVAVSVTCDTGLHTAEPYRFTQNAFSGSMTVNWILKASAQGRATAFVPRDFFPAANAICTLNVYAEQSAAATKACACLLVRGAPSCYSGARDGDQPISAYTHEHNLYTEDSGRILCCICGYEKCRHLTKEYVNIVAPTCNITGKKRLKCTDICGLYLGNTVTAECDPNYHAGNRIKTTYDPAKDRMGLRCLGCNHLFALISGKPETTVYVGKNSGTPISAANAPEHFATSSEPIGCREQYPFENFEDAMRYAAMAAKLHGSATVVILDDAYLRADYTVPTHTGTITVTGGTLHFDYDCGRFLLDGDMIFENMSFRSNNTSESVIIAARNHKLVMGEGLTMDNSTTIPTETGFAECNSVKMYVIGGFIGRTQMLIDTDITIRSGDYWYIGGWNYNASTNDGTGKITIGKTNPDDKLQVFYLCPFSRGDGYITKTAESTIIVDGDLYVKRFYVTTLNKATMHKKYVTNIVLQGDITGYNEDDHRLQFDLRGCPPPYPLTAIHLYTDSRVATAVEDSYVFLGHPNGSFYYDSSLNRLEAVVRAYSYEDYCQAYLGGHDQVGENDSCSKCGYIAPQEPEEEPEQELE